MKMEYPEYYERFSCIAEACTDSCCARWEIDVDEESYYRYLTVQGPFGERIRGCLHTEESVGEDGYPEYEWSFPLTPDRRCPFLNDGDLCDMYTALGHDKLPRTCREFPRGDACVGAYHQVDIALACPEANRLIFEDLAAPVTYVTRDEPTGVPALDRYCASEERPLALEEQELLDAVLAERDQLIELLQDETVPLAERYGTLFAMSAEYGFDPSAESHSDLVDLIDEMELLDERWTRVYDPVKRAMDTGFPSAFVLEGLADSALEDAQKGCTSTSETHTENTATSKTQTGSTSISETNTESISTSEAQTGSTSTSETKTESISTSETQTGSIQRNTNQSNELEEKNNPTLKDLKVAAVESERELTRFLVYLVFRYYIDGYFEGSLTGVYRLLLRGFHMMRLLLAALTPAQYADPATRRDLYHVWSREVEHSPENFALIKGE